MLNRKAFLHSILELENFCPITPLGILGHTTELFLSSSHQMKSETIYDKSDCRNIKRSCF